jgi:hypothetical protein
MTVSFYIQREDTFTLQSYLEDFDEEAENPILYIGNQPSSPEDILISISFYEYNELIDLEVLEWL